MRGEGKKHTLLPYERDEEKGSELHYEYRLFVWGPRNEQRPQTRSRDRFLIDARPLLFS